MRSASRNAGRSELQTMPRSTHRSIRSNHKRLFERGLMLPQGHLPANLEVLLVPGIAAFVNVHVRMEVTRCRSEASSPILSASPASQTGSTRPTRSAGKSWASDEKGPGRSAEAFVTGRSSPGSTGLWGPRIRTMTIMAEFSVKLRGDRRFVGKARRGLGRADSRQLGHRQKPSYDRHWRLSDCQFTARARPSRSLANA